MKYDFTTLLNRKGHDALALDVLPIKDVEVDPNFSTIPMWVADMNYPVFENIQKQMFERIIWIINILINSFFFCEGRCLL